MIYRVYYPLISGDAHRDFTDKAAAESFRQQWMDTCSRSRYLTIHSWRRVQLVEMEDDPYGMAEERRRHP